MGVPLQPAERMAAITGPWSTLAAELKDRYLPANGGQFTELMQINCSRSKPFLMMAQILMAAQRVPEPCQFTSARVEKFLRSTNPPTESFKQEIQVTLNKYVLVASALARTDTSRPAIAPVEFVMVAVLIHGKPDLAVDVLAQLVVDLRVRMKSLFHDLRINAKQIKAAYEFLRLG